MNGLLPSFLHISSYLYQGIHLRNNYIYLQIV